MKKIVSTSFIILITYFPCFSQLKDDFSDGDFLSNPVWENKSGYFTVEGGMLHLNAPAISGEDFITTSSHFIYDASWEFRIHLQFNPSSYNYSDVYLFADDKDIPGHVLGYLVRVGGQKDVISLLRRDGEHNKMTTLISSREKLTDRDSADFRIKVTRDRNGTWKLFYTDFSDTDFKLIGTSLDDRYQSPNYFAIFCHYTSTRSDRFYFDDISISGDQLRDASSPELDTVFATGSGRICIVFNEKLEKASAVNVAGYRLSGIGNPDSVRYNEAFKRITLYFGTSLIDQQQYNLLLTGQYDLAGNKIRDTEISFTNYNPIDADPGSIVINEFMPDPLPEVELPGYEFIELFNTTERYIRLAGCKINDRVINDLVIKPQGYAILCPEAAINYFTKYGSIVRGISKWNAINNSSDVIVLSDPSRDIIDKVDFHNSWFNNPDKNNGGWTLELINTDFRCWGKKAWAVSISNTGGTPGYVNSVDSEFVDNLQKGYRDFRVSGKEVLLTFFDPVHLTGESKFSLEANTILHEQILDNDPFSVILSLEDSLNPGKPYTLQISDVQDCSLTYWSDSTILIGRGIKPGFAKILITEIMNKPSPSKGLPDIEYIEMYNPGTQIINIGGSILITGSDSVMLPDKNFLPDEYRVVLRKNIAGSSMGHFIVLPELAPLDDKGENLVILNSSRDWVFQVDFKKDWIQGGIRGGTSIEMVDPGNPCGKVGNWLLSESSTGGTPGRINSVNNTNPDNFGPVLENVSAVSPDLLLLKFSEYILPGNMLPYNLSIGNELLVQDFSFISLDVVSCTLNTQISPGTSYTLKARNVTDCTGNLIQNENSGAFALPSPADSGDIVINEILFNPLPGGIDFIELYNRSGKFIDINRFSFSGKADTSGIKYPLVSMPDIMKPGSYYAFTINKNRTINDYPQGEPLNIIENDRLPAMNNDRGTVVLFSGENRIIDIVKYNDNMHFSLLRDTEGVSLERIDPDKPSDDPMNWQSAAGTSGFGTPGRRNSESFPDSLIQGNIKIEPRVFIPGNTGTDAQAKICYTFDKPGLVGNVRIYNIKGVPVRYLANNVSLSTAGYLTWDGTNERGSLAATGYYIVSFEVFSLDGTHRSFIDKVVLGTQF